MRFPISAKLVGLIGVLLACTVVSLVWIATQMFVQDNKLLIQQTNVDMAASLTMRVRDTLEAFSEKMRVLGSLLMQPVTSDKNIQTQFFNDDKDFLALYLIEGNGPFAKVKGASFSPQLASMGDGNGEKAKESLLSQRDFSLAQIQKGEGSVVAVRLADSTAALAIGLPFIEDTLKKGSFRYALVGLIRQNRFAKMFSESDVLTSFMFDRKGNLLAHPEMGLVDSGESVANLEIVKQSLKGNFNNGQTRYEDPQTKEAKLGAFRLAGFGGLGIVVEVPEAKAFEAANRVQYRAVLVALIILSFAFLVGYYYSDSITWPINQLVAAASRIKNGDFDIQLKPKSRDELADLGLAFNSMAAGLAERDRVKATFSKFHNKEIADRLLSGEVKLGGEKLTAVIFFSDIRGFTHLSETMTPEQVVEMLNEYMTRMVKTIRKHHGIVDKYVGDAIMALWGVPISGGNDAKNAIAACLEMRQELAALNEVRISRGQPVLKIGMGLNQGEVIAGNIGSEEKMEYTVIGDSVNLASRIESMTKAFGTDLLVADTLFDKLGDQFIFEACDKVEVKGKSKPVSLFKVSGIKHPDGRTEIIQTAYSSYEAEKADKGKVVTDEKAA